MIEPCYAVVRVEQPDGEYVEDVSCICTFKTIEEAETYKSNIIKECDLNQKNREEYIRNFVDSIEVPETDYEGWKKFMEQCYGNTFSYTFPKDFKKEYFRYLLYSYFRVTNNEPELLINFNPPPPRNDHLNLFVVEIK